MPLAIAFAKKAEVIGFDINKEKVKQYLKGIDMTNEVGNEALKNTTAFFYLGRKSIFKKPSSTLLQCLLLLIQINLRI